MFRKVLEASVLQANGARLGGLWKPELEAGSILLAQGGSPPLSTASPERRLDKCIRDEKDSGQRMWVLPMIPEVGNFL